MKIFNKLIYSFLFLFIGTSNSFDKQSLIDQTINQTKDLISVSSVNPSIAIADDILSINLKPLKDCAISAFNYAQTVPSNLKNLATSTWSRFQEAEVMNNVWNTVSSISNVIPSATDLTINSGKFVFSGLKNGFNLVNNHKGKVAMAALAYYAYKKMRNSNKQSSLNDGKVVININVQGGSQSQVSCNPAQLASKIQDELIKKN